MSLPDRASVPRRRARAAAGLLRRRCAGPAARCGRSIRARRSPTGIAVGAAPAGARSPSSRSTTRYAQQVRNHLIFLLNGGAGEPATPAYTLALQRRRTIVLDVGLGRSRQRGRADGRHGDNDRRPTTLTDVEDRQGGCVAASARSRRPIDLPSQEFAALRAQTRRREPRGARTGGICCASIHRPAAGARATRSFRQPRRTSVGLVRERSQPIFWPVLAQSARNCSRPLSVSGCLTSAFRSPAAR